MSEDAPPYPAIPQFAPDAQVCGNCKLWQLHSVDDQRGWVGPCRVQPGRGMFPPSAPICDAFTSKHGTARAAVVPDRATVSRTARVSPVIVRRRQDAGDGAGKASESKIHVGEVLGGDWAMTREELIQIFREASGDVEVPLAKKWEGGTVRLIPGSAELQPKDLPIDSLFHKVVMIRDRLRTLEQKLNGHATLSDGEKVELQQYITRIYGSLTTFNVLFKEKSDQFVGAKSED